MKVIILAGGKGKRLRPYTTVLPKPLMPIGDTPILEIIFNQLKHYGFTDITLALGHKANYIKTFFMNKSQSNIKLTYSYESKDLGTAGPLKLVDNLDENFLVMNGDVLTDFNFSEFFKNHKDSGAIATIAVYSKIVNIDLGVIETDNNQVTGYTEKPTINVLVSMGIYAFNKKILEFIPYNEHFDIPDLVKKVLKNGEVINSFNQPECLWLDIGNITEFQHSQEIYEKNKSRFLPNSSL